MSSASCCLRRGRHSGAGYAYLLTACCYNRLPLLAHDAAARIVLASAQWLNRNRQMTLMAAVVMPEHIHVVARLRTEPLAVLMRNLKGHTAHQINRVMDVAGRFGSGDITTADCAMTLMSMRLWTIVCKNPFVPD